MTVSSSCVIVTVTGRHSQTQRSCQLVLMQEDQELHVCLSVWIMMCLCHQSLSWVLRVSQQLFWMLTRTPTSCFTSLSFWCLWTLVFLLWAHLDKNTFLCLAPASFWLTGSVLSMSCTSLFPAVFPVCGQTRVFQLRTWFLPPVHTGHHAVFSL